ncbi:chemotaxis protein [Aliidiomarina taiwanensis]|uniref:Chemotaxis protein n=1 Tax=Aliidiomarina taiwanensis TaxID=946228 RepID=A0A432XA71_9GAMM|nr:PAS domain-containing methyl-accepting chemotaxis protein [Aliidiomarina taiwanensis]RUO44303.1 chemotaxis protein [Aliidiomarina taiwanensis]
MANRRQRHVTQTEYEIAPGDRLISTTNTRGVITYFNECFRQASGYDANELLGAPHNIIRHPDMPKAAFADMWATIKQGQPWMGLVKNRRKNGDFYWVSAYVTPIFDEGKVTGYESVRVRATENQKKRATAIYQRLHKGQSSTSKLESAKRWAKYILPTWVPSLTLAIGLAATSYTFWSVLVLAATGLGMVIQTVSQKSSYRAIRAIRPNAFANRVIAETYSDYRGARAELEMVLRSEEARARTGFARIEDATSGLYEVVANTRDQAASNSALVDEQNHATQEAVSAIEQMRAAIQEVAVSVDNNAQQSQEASTSVDESSRLAGESLVTIQELSQLVHTIVSTVNELAESTDAIGETADLISNIADQTNLLALNAAIEAARAGEHGRGFSVVADEVRTLAARTQESTSRIHGIIETLRERADNAVRVSSLGEEAAQRGVGMAQETDSALKHIRAAIESIAAGTLQMSSAVEQQRGATEHMSEQVTHIAEGAGRAQLNANETFEASIQLEQTARELHALVRRFAMNNA